MSLFQRPKAHSNMTCLFRRPIAHPSMMGPRLLRRPIAHPNTTSPHLFRRRNPSMRIFRKLPGTHNLRVLYLHPQQNMARDNNTLNSNRHRLVGYREVLTTGWQCKPGICRLMTEALLQTRRSCPRPQNRKNPTTCFSKISWTSQGPNLRPLRRSPPTVAGPGERTHSFPGLTPSYCLYNLFFISVLYETKEESSLAA